MNPYLAALVAAGIITQEEAERINRSLNPTAARAWAEQQLAVAMQGGLSAQQQRLVDLLRARNGNVSQTELDAFWRAEDDRLWQALRVNVEEVASETAIGAATRLGGTWNYVNERVIGWTNAYYTSGNPAFVGSVPNLNQTTRQQVADAFVRWNRGELNNGRSGGLPALIVELQDLPQFNPTRAALVAATEVTRIFAEAENAAAETDADLEYMTWQAANDELMCAVCAPLNGRSVRKGQEFLPGVRLPPAHPNCRCTVTATTGPAEEATRGTQQKPKQPTKPVDKLAAAIQPVEKSIYTLPKERAYVFDAEGNVLLSKDGAATSVRFTDDETKLFKGNVLTHNHPNPENNPEKYLSAVSFSPADVEVTTFYKLKEMRAVGDKYVHTLNTSEDLTWKETKRVYNRVQKKVTSDFLEKIRNKEMTAADANTNFFHEVWTRVGAELGEDRFKYRRIEHEY